MTKVAASKERVNELLTQKVLFISNQSSGAINIYHAYCYGPGTRMYIST